MFIRFKDRGAKRDSVCHIAFGSQPPRKLAKFERIVPFSKSRVAAASLKRTALTVCVPRTVRALDHSLLYVQKAMSRHLV